MLMQYTSTAVATRSEGGYLSQFSDMLEFLSHQKIFYKTCMRAVKMAMNFQMILISKGGPSPFDMQTLLVQGIGELITVYNFMKHRIDAPVDSRIKKDWYM